MSVPITIFEPNGSLRSGVKSSMIKPLIGDIEYCALPEHNPATSTIIIDVMSRVQSIGLPKLAVNFGDLADTFTMSVLQSAKTFHRIELVGDRYRATSIKDCAREKRTKRQSTGIRKTIDSRSVPLPTSQKDFDAFLSMKENKSDLQRFLSNELLSNMPSDKIIVAAGVFEDEKCVRSNQNNIDLRALSADHEEADTRIVLHCAHSTSDFIVISSRDTDIIILLLAHHNRFPNRDIYITMHNKVYLNLGILVTHLGPQICDSLLLCHSITGCDTVSFMYGIGKVTAVKVLQENPGILQGICRMTDLTASSIARGRGP